MRIAHSGDVSALERFLEKGRGGEQKGMSWERRWGECLRTRASSLSGVGEGERETGRSEEIGMETAGPEERERGRGKQNKCKSESDGESDREREREREKEWEREREKEWERAVVQWKDPQAWRTALHMAARQGHAMMVRALAERGGEVEAR